MSCGRLFSQLPGHLITFRQSFLIFTQSFIYNFSILQRRPADAATQAEPFLSFGAGTSDWLPEQSLACWLFFSSGPHQICISSSESSVYLTLHSRASAVHLTLIRFPLKPEQRWPDATKCVFFPKAQWECVHRGEEAAPLWIMCWYMWYCDSTRPFLAINALKNTGKASRSSKFNCSFLSGACICVVKY